MKLAGIITLHAGGKGSGPNAPCPQCGPHKYKVGDRVRRDPKIWKGKMGVGPENFGEVVSVEHGTDDKGKHTYIYKILDDHEKARAEDFKKNPKKYDPIWDKPKLTGVPYHEKELVPHVEKKKKVK